LLDRSKKLGVLNAHGGDLKNFAADKLPQVPLQWVQRSSPREKCNLLGEHNQDNLAVAMALAHAAGWPALAFEEMRKFPGLPHRMENLGIHRGVQYVNDSKATTMESVQMAVQSLEDSYQGSLHLLLGGRDKNLPWERLSSFRNRPRLKCYFFGECAVVAQQNSKLHGDRFARLADAVRAAQKSSAAGDLILLSPGGTSLDEFKSFEDRGKAFAKML
jgi:UDP-N-acetylmuramoylalanine--D-glutamate ligase